MHETNIKEELSINYISAISANAGIDYETLRHDDDSTDGLIKKLIDLPNMGAIHSVFRVQLKSTSSESMYTEDAKEIRYSLKAKNYNDLCQRSTTPIILCLLILPSKRQEWLHWSEAELLLRGCMYWTSLAGKVPSSNKESITVTFDKKHVVNSDTLQELLEKIAREEEL